MQPADTPQAQPPPRLLPAPSAPSWPRWLLAAGFVLAIVAFYATGLYRLFSWESVHDRLDVWLDLVHEHLLLSLLIFFLVYVALTALSVPGATPLTLLAGALFGLVAGTAVVSIASTLGATLAFLSSRYLFRDWVQRRFADRLEAINRGIEKDGAWYLFTLRLVPLVPFFLINLGMGLTRIRVGTFAVVSWAGMLLGTLIYVNTGTALAALDSPEDLLSVRLLAALALLGLVPLALRKLVQWRVRWQTIGLALGGTLLLAAAVLGVRTYYRYQTSEIMEIAIREYSNAEYPEDPANRSVHHHQYSGRRLTLVKKDATHFDFVFEPNHPHIARVAFRDIDASLMTPGLPDWVRDDAGLLRIALTDRQWNRQQVRFGGPGSPHVEVTGGDGFETANLHSAELAKNCLNAGLWEVLLFTKENNEKALYYQGWFTFPLGHYRDLFEHNTHLPYARHWYYLEHWIDPAGTPIALDRLRQVVRERETAVQFDPQEEVIVAGEQSRKRRTMMADNVIHWGDFYDGRKVRFASFVPPGRYSVVQPWKNEYRRIDRLERALLREVRSPATDRPLHELELIFSSAKMEGRYRLFVSGFELGALPQLPVRDYPNGMYMPMGIGVPPFFQGYDELQQRPPNKAPYFSVLLDGQDRWIDHHSLAIDGPVLHRDDKDPNLLHLYLLSYERHSLISHAAIPAGELFQGVR